MQIVRLRNLEEFEAYTARDAENMQEHLAILASYVPADKLPFTVPGFSYTAQRNVEFMVDFSHSDGEQVNWREHVNCPITQFNNRMRSTIQLVETQAGIGPIDRIYITEQVTLMYRHLKKRFKNLVGSEFMGDGVAPGFVRRDGVRHEDVTKLSFPDESFDAIVSLDVLEHVPDFNEAFREMYRVLKKGGRLIWSVPFAPQLGTNLIRARETPDGIEHLYEPEYHVNPMSHEGSLCFTHFGWQMLEDVHTAGFEDACSLCFYSMEYGYLGGYQHLFFARK